uniref:GAF sensor protein putative n=1 Tax=Albugo laibachii Nc14 TaxID=890382 RepID=F0W9G9_9STRA|nr:GAF sensor protein putative [Albugo laibachii Nc14]|eukprot:CCA17783.1 GAF sensor protein putative [Albugo laibachii Nc14]
MFYSSRLLQSSSILNTFVVYSLCQHIPSHVTLRLRSIFIANVVKAVPHSTMSIYRDTGLTLLSTTNTLTNSHQSTHKARRRTSSYRLLMPPEAIAADVTRNFSQLSDPFLTNFVKRTQNQGIRQFSSSKADQLHSKRLSHETVEYVYKMCSSIQLRASVNQIVDVLESPNVKSYVAAMKMTLGTNFVGGRYLFRQFRPLTSEQLEGLSPPSEPETETEPEIEPSLIKVQAMRLRTKGTHEPQDLYFGTCTQRLPSQKRAVIAWKTIPKIVHERLVDRQKCLCLQNDIQSIGVTFDIQTNVRGNLTRVFALTTVRFRSKSGKVALGDVPPPTRDVMSTLVNALYNLDHVIFQRKLGALVVYPEPARSPGTGKCVVCSKRSRWYRRTTSCGICRSTTCSKCVHGTQVWPQNSKQLDTQVCKLCLIRAEMEPANEAFLPLAFTPTNEYDHKRNVEGPTATLVNFDDMLLSSTKMEKRLIQSGRQQAGVPCKRINVENISNSLQIGPSTRTRSHSSCSDAQEVSMLYARGIACERPKFQSVYTPRPRGNGIIARSSSFDTQSNRTKRNRALSYQPEPLTIDLTSKRDGEGAQHATRSIIKQSAPHVRRRARKFSVLQSMCQVIASRLGCQNVFVGVVLPNGVHLTAFIGLEDERFKLATETRFRPYAQRGKPFIVKDTNKDKEWRKRTSDAVHARFVMGIPLKTGRRSEVSLLCAFDNTPRKSLSSEEYQMMESAAKLVGDVMECVREDDPALP